MEFTTYTIYTGLVIEVQQDAWNRNFIIHRGQRYLVPQAAFPDRDCDSWICHERHRIAVPADLEKHDPFVKFTGPREEEGGSVIFTVHAESLACAHLMAAAVGHRIFGWGTGCQHDCSGRTFSSPADHFIMEKSFHDPGDRQASRRYGFEVSWAIDC